MWVSVCVSFCVDELLDKQKPPLLGVPFQFVTFGILSVYHPPMGLLPQKIRKILGVVRAAGSSAAAGRGIEGRRGGSQSLD